MPARSHLRVPTVYLTMAMAAAAAAGAAGAAVGLVDTYVPPPRRLLPRRSPRAAGNLVGSRSLLVLAHRSSLLGRGLPVLRQTLIDNMALGPSLTVESVLMAVVVVCVVAAVSSRWAWAWGREAESKRGGDGDWVHEEEAAPATTAASDAAKENVVADCRVVAEKDLAKANKLFDKALRAYSRIEYMEERGEVLLSSLPAALQAEMDEVVAMWTEAAAQGHMMAQAHLGELYNTGRGVKLDLERAVAFYTQAANQGNLGCQYQLGIKCRDGGRGCPQSHKRSVEWLQLAAAQNEGSLRAVRARIRLQRRQRRPAELRGMSAYESALIYRSSDPPVPHRIPHRPFSAQKSSTRNPWRAATSSLWTYLRRSTSKKKAVILAKR